MTDDGRAPQRDSRLLGVLPPRASRARGHYRRSSAVVTGSVVGGFKRAVDGAERVDYTLGELGTGAASQLCQRGGCVHAARVDALRGHRVVSVADEDDLGAEGNLVARKPVGIAAPVPALVRRADRGAD